MSKRKTFKKFRDEWEDDEWGENEDRHVRNKEKRLENRRSRKRQKFTEKFSSIDDSEWNK